MTAGQKLNYIWRFGRQSRKKPRTWYARPTVDQTPSETLSEHFTWGTLKKWGRGTVKKFPAFCAGHVAPHFHIRCVATGRADVPHYSELVSVTAEQMTYVINYSEYHFANAKTSVISASSNQ